MGKKSLRPEWWSRVNWEELKEFISKHFPQIKGGAEAFISKNPDWGHLCILWPTYIELRFWLIVDSRPQRKQIFTQVDSQPKVEPNDDEKRLMGEFVSQLIKGKNLKAKRARLEQIAFLFYEIRVEDYGPFFKNARKQAP